MRRDIVKTGRYGIGTQVHTVHVGRDAGELTRFYEDVFDAVVYLGADEPFYSPYEDRYATLAVISDFCIESMAPKEPVDPRMPVGRFFLKYGSHLHSVGYTVDDLVGLGNDLIAQGVRIAKPGGGFLEGVDADVHYVYPHPRDTAGLMVELCATDMRGDPRLLDDWSSELERWSSSPLGITRLAHQTVGVRDLEVSGARFEELFGAVPVAEGESGTEGARYRVLHLGDGLLRLAQPTVPGTPLADHVERFGDMIHSVTFRVRDLDSAERWLAEKKVGTTRLSESLLVTDPADTLGAPYCFTVEDLPGDPFVP